MKIAERITFANKRGVADVDETRVGLCVLKIS